MKRISSKNLTGLCRFVSIATDPSWKLVGKWTGGGRYPESGTIFANRSLMPYGWSIQAFVLNNDWRLV